MTGEKKKSTKNNRKAPVYRVLRQFEHYFVSNSFMKCFNVLLLCTYEEKKKKNGVVYSVCLYTVITFDNFAEFYHYFFVFLVFSSGNIFSVFDRT